MGLGTRGQTSLNAVRIIITSISVMIMSSIIISMIMRLRENGPLENVSSNMKKLSPRGSATGEAMKIIVRVVCTCVTCRRVSMYI